MHDLEDALEHKSRKLIYNYILTNPGASFGTILKFLDMKYSTLAYHLYYLEKADKIFSKREGRHRCYFCKEKSRFDPGFLQSPDHKPLTDTQARILTVIHSRPGITKKQLTAATRFNRKKIDYNIKKLLDYKIIWEVNSGATVGYKYIPRDELMDEVLGKLILKLLNNEIDEKTFLKIMRKLESENPDELEE